MKPYRRSLALLFAFAIVLYPNHNTRADDADTETRDTTQYLVELWEYELDEAIPIGLSEAEVVDAICGSSAKTIETIRLTAIADTDSRVQFGRRITVTTAKMTQGNTTSRQIKERVIVESCVLEEMKKVAHPAETSTPQPPEVGTRIRHEPD